MQTAIMQELEHKCVLALVPNGLRKDFLTRRLVQAFTSVYPPFLRHALHTSNPANDVTNHPSSTTRTSLKHKA